MFKLAMRFKPDKDTRVTAGLIHLVAGILAWALSTAFAAGQFQHLEMAADFHADSLHMQAHGKPMVILFSQRDCSWCERARAQLSPMAGEFAAGQGALFRQIDIDRDTALIDFNGSNTTHRRFARENAARLTPTLLFVGPEGQTFGEPILGMRIPDFYAHYVMQAIEQARAAMRAQTQE